MRVGEEGTADVRAIAILRLARELYGAYHRWKCSQADVEGFQRELEIYKEFLAKYGDFLSEDLRESLERRIEEVEEDMNDAKEVVEDYYKCLRDVEKEVEKVLEGGGK